MKRLLLASLSALSIASASATASAGSGGFHGGIGWGAVVGLASDGSAGALNPTLHFDLGARLTPSASLYFRGEIGSVIIANQAAAYVVAEWQATRRLSLASGIGVDAMAVVVPAMGGGTWAGASIPLIAGFKLAHHGSHDLRLNLEGAVGADARQTIGWHVALSLEDVWN